MLREMLLASAGICLLAAPALADPNFVDNFDNNFAGEPGIVGSVWPKWPAATDHLNASTSHNHTPGGTTSAWLQPEYTAGFANYHDFGGTSGSVDATVWVWDDLTAGSGHPLDGVGSTGPVNMYFGLYGDAANPTTDTNHLLIGLNPAFAPGSVDTTSDNQYGVNTGSGGVNNYFTTPVTRIAAVAGSPDPSTNWVKLEVQADPLSSGGAVRFYIDNALVDTASRASGVNLRYVFIGSLGLSGGHSGQNYGNFWYDDVSVTPEPASLSVLGLGGLLALRRRRGRC